MLEGLFRGRQNPEKQGREEDERAERIIDKTWNEESLSDADALTLLAHGKQEDIALIESAIESGLYTPSIEVAGRLKNLQEGEDTEEQSTH